MQFDKCIKEFENYVTNYDLNVLQNRYKYDHTFRVLEFTKTICESEKFTEEEKYLACVCSLLHDIARFEEWTKYHSWHEIDHGDLGYEILNKNDYILKYVDKKYNDIVLNVVKYHNKKDIADDLDELTIKVLKVVRDADKLDILNTQFNPYNEKSLTLDYDYSQKVKLNNSIIDSFISEKMLDANMVTNIAEDIIFYLSYIFDINYRISFKIIYDLKVIDIKLELLKKVLSDDTQFKIIELKAKDFLESNIKL